MNRWNVPCEAGSLKNYTATPLAERVLAIVGELPKRQKCGTRLIPARYAVLVDFNGHVSVDRCPDYLSAEWVSTVDYKSDPDDLADELRECIA